MLSVSVCILSTLWLVHGIPPSTLFLDIAGCTLTTPSPNFAYKSVECENVLSASVC